MVLFFFFFSSRRRHTRCYRDWSSDVCSSDLNTVDSNVARVRFSGRYKFWYVCIGRRSEPPMGLNAYVFLSKAHLPFDADALGAEFDADTGEYFFSDTELDRKYSLDARTTCPKRIGNIAAVSQLREGARRVLGESSVVLSKVIYSGTHCGD